MHNLGGAQARAGATGYTEDSEVFSLFLNKNNNNNDNNWNGNKNEPGGGRNGISFQEQPNLRDLTPKAGMAGIE